MNPTPLSSEDQKAIEENAPTVNDTSAYYRQGYKQGAEWAIRYCNSKRWNKGSPPANGRYSVLVLWCDLPTEYRECYDDYKDGYWQNYAQFVDGWKDIDFNYEMISAAKELILAIDLTVTTAYPYKGALERLRRLIQSAGSSPDQSSERKDTHHKNP